CVYLPLSPLHRTPRRPLFPSTTLFRSESQARHLTRHGAVQNEDGTYSWKFDNAARFGGGPVGQISPAEQQRLWSRIACPVLLVRDRKSTRLNSSHVKISYAVFCLKKKK